MTNVQLIEPGVKHLLSKTLQYYHKIHLQTQSIRFNLTMIVVFVIVFGGILIYKYKGKLTPEQIYQKHIEKQEYIVSKLEQLAVLKQTIDPNMITNLPLLDQSPETSRMNRKIYI
uniref:Uncharacterized protein n=1 Tax=viral metagenome TaxID=1070528 RepID=A0A6C0JUU5_9ZZZZ